MWQISDLRKGTDGRFEGAYSLESTIDSFSIDSRTMEKNCLFIALQGPNFDGHDFLESAFEGGAVGAMVSSSTFLQREKSWQSLLKDHFVICVKDTLLGLQSLAKWHRQRFSLPLIGVTGSNGKTTTKEMIASIFSQAGTILKNKGNLNNHIGLPLSLLRLNEKHQAAVLEMGVSAKGEMTRLCNLARPTIGLITNVGPAHLEGLGTLEGVAEEKGVLYRSVAKEGMAVINLDDSFLGKWAVQEKWEMKAQNRWTFGFAPGADVRAEHVESTGTGMTFTLLNNRDKKTSAKVVLPVSGRHQVMNALAAATAASAVGLPLEVISKGLAGFRPLKQRTEIHQKNGVVFYFDAYNANPASVEAALELLASAPGTGRRIALLGEMFEMGASRESAHLKVGLSAARYGIDRLLAVGKSAEWMIEGARKGGMKEKWISDYSALEDAGLALKKNLKAGDRVLIKGSRGMKMEKLLPLFGIDAGGRS